MTISLVTSEHVYESFITAYTNAANGTISIHSMLVPMPVSGTWHKQHFLSVVLLCVAGLAIWSVTDRKLNPTFAACLLVPQQLLLLMPFFGALVASLLGHYFDGYAPDGLSPWAFISADQVLRILIAPYYVLAVLARRKWYGQGRFGVKD